uniref:Uncharacterized protein n=1 Tax=Medicago truncatula TaxID=3880 RepID=A2Q161_MEDTR|nr:hypothetical protein MtrDRAFT_AC147963g31v2 [Medicago truncatula]
MCQRFQESLLARHGGQEIQAKVDATLTNRGGGKAGLLGRIVVEKGGHAKEHHNLIRKSIKVLNLKFL